VDEEVTAELAVWALDSEDTDSQKLAQRLGVPLYVQEDPPAADSLRWLLFLEDDALFLHSFGHDFKPLCVNYLERDFQRRWKSLSRNDLLLKAVGAKKGVRTICDPTCGLGYDAFLLATVLDLEVTACERNVVLAELVMNALLRLKESGRFEEFPLYFHFGDGLAFLEQAGEGAFDCVYLDPMYPRDESRTAKQKKEMQLVRELVGKDEDAGALFAAAWRAARKRVVVKRADDAESLDTGRQPDAVLEGKTVRYDVYLKSGAT
jgi:16S rRNA (guanine1516-N2)-methyltransferase